MEFATAKQLQDLYGVKRQTITRAIKQGRLRAEPFAGRWLIRIADFLEWRDRYYNKARAEAQKRRWAKVKSECQVIRVGKHKLKAVAPNNGTECKA